MQWKRSMLRKLLATPFILFGCASLYIGIWIAPADFVAEILVKTFIETLRGLKNGH